MAEPRVSRSKEYFSEKEYGVKASPRVVAAGQPVPKGGGRVVTGKPYKVKDQWFYPDDPAHAEVGMASWYGSAFHGRLTANGEVYDIGGLTAAHPTMPLPSYARVTNLSNSRTMVVRVNDRGPFLHGRVMDLSARAAELLDVKRKGVAKVKVQYVGPARMDGQDEGMLLASYQTKGSTMVASHQVAAPRPGVMLASLSVPPPPRLRPPVDYGRDQRSPARGGSGLSIDELIYGAADQPSRFVVPASAAGGDPIGRLIDPTAAVRSYGEDGRGMAGQAAIASAALGHPTEGEGVAVQAGVFANPANAERLARTLARYGTVEVVPVTVGGKALQAVRVRVNDPSVPAERIVALAEARASGNIH